MKNFFPLLFALSVSLSPTQAFPFPGKSGGTPAAAAPKSATPNAGPVGKDVAPPNSPVSIWIPENWSKDANPDMFDVVYSDSNSEAAVGFKFLNQEGKPAAQVAAKITQEGHELLKQAFKDLTDVQNSGAQTKREVAGMSVEFQELKAKLNVPSDPKMNGQSVDIAVVFVATPSDRVVCAVFTTLSSKAEDHKDQLLKILENLRPRSGKPSVAKAPTPTPTPKPIPTATPKSIAVGKDMAPPNSPVSIWIPDGWTKEAKPEPFDLGFSSPQEEANVGFTFLKNTNPAAATLESQQLLAKVFTEFTNIEKFGDQKTISVGGMPADYQELKGQLDGESVDLGFAIVKTPTNRFVLMMVWGSTSKVRVHQENTSNILRNLRPR